MRPSISPIHYWLKIVMGGFIEQFGGPGSKQRQVKAKLLNWRLLNALSRNTKFQGSPLCARISRVPPLQSSLQLYPAAKLFQFKFLNNFFMVWKLPLLTCYWIVGLLPLSLFFCVLFFLWVAKPENHTSMKCWDFWCAHDSGYWLTNSWEIRMTAYLNNLTVATLYFCQVLFKQTEL